MKYINYAHRGASQYAPENTLRAFYLGLDMGANGIETDIHLTKDGIPVLFHDDTLERCTNGCGRITDFTYRELLELRVFCPQNPAVTDTICTLEELLLHFGWRDLTFAIELKQDHVARETLELLQKYGMKEKTFITSFNFESLQEAAALCPDWRFGWLKEDFTAEDLEALRRIGGIQLCPRARVLTEEKVAFWNRMGFTVRAWGIADTELMARAVECGTDGQTVNFPDKLTAYLNGRN